MSSQVVLQSLLIGIVGFLLGSYLPVALLYLVLYIKKHKFSLRLVPKLLVRIVAIPILWILGISILVGLLTEADILPKKLYGPLPMWFGFGTIFGLIGGVTAFVVWLKRGIRSAKHGSSQVQ